VSILDAHLVSSRDRERFQPEQKLLPILRRCPRGADHLRQSNVTGFDPVELRKVQNFRRESRKTLFDQVFSRSISALSRHIHVSLSTLRKATSESTLHARYHTTSSSGSIRRSAVSDLETKERGFPRRSAKSRCVRPAPERHSRSKTHSLRYAGRCCARTPGFLLAPNLGAS